MVVAGICRNYQPSFSSKDAALDKMESKEMGSENCGSVLMGEKRKVVVVFKVRNHQLLRGLFK